MCCHNISFLFSVTPLWKGEINNSFPFSISSNKIKCSKSLHFVFLLFSTKSLLVVLIESAMCCHNISFLFSVTPFWKCEVNNSFSFYILIKSNFLNRCILFFTLFDEISPCPDICLFPVKADDNCPEGSGFMRSTVGHDCALHEKYWQFPL